MSAFPPTHLLGQPWIPPEARVDLIRDAPPAKVRHRHAAHPVYLGKPVGVCLHQRVTPGTPMPVGRPHRPHRVCVAALRPMREVGVEGGGLAREKQLKGRLATRRGAGETSAAREPAQHGVNTQKVER